METTYTYSDKNAPTAIRTSVLNFLTRLPSKYATVFRVLSHAGNPYVPINASLIARPAAGNHNTGQQIAQLEQQINALMQTVAWLKDQVHAQPEPASIGAGPYPAKAPKQPREIGLTRFRALQAER